MDVKIEIQCERCQKKNEKILPLEQAQGLEQRQVERDTAFREFGNKVTEMYNDNLPELIMIQKSPSQDVTLYSLNDLCTAPDAKRNKGCKARVDALITEIFTPIKKKTTKKSTPKTTKDNGKEKK